MNVTGYRLKSKELTHVGLEIIRAMAVLDDGRQKEVHVVQRDTTHYTISRSRGTALKQAMVGGLDKVRPPLVWLAETAERRIFPIEEATR